MKIPTSREHRELSENKAMTPMIDVVFLLLIFFVCAAVGQVQELFLATDLSGGSISSTEIEEREDPLPPVWIFLRRNAENTQTVMQVGKGGEEYTQKKNLREHLGELADVGREEIALILDIAPEVPAGDLVFVYDACRHARFQNIMFATKPKKQKSKSAAL